METANWVDTIHPHLLSLDIVELKSQKKNQINRPAMTLAELEIHDDHILLSIPTDALTQEIESRLTSEGWGLATNGHKENGEWQTIYVKHI